MMTLLTIREKIRNFLQKYDKILYPISKFVLSLIILIGINYMFGYSKILQKFEIELLIAVICAFIPSSLFLAVMGVISVVEISTLSLDLAIMYLIIFFIIYMMYLRISLNQAYVILLIPILFLIKIPYLAPILIGMFIGCSGIISAICGVLLYYLYIHIDNVSTLISVSTEKSDIQAYSYVIQNLLKDYNMILMMLCFIFVIIITSVIYKMSINYSWYIAILVAVITNVLLYLIGGFMFQMDINAILCIFTSIISGIIAIVIQFFRCVVDYSRIEEVQFEDDDYYYYVKAVPKINFIEENVKVKKINERD